MRHRKQTTGTVGNFALPAAYIIGRGMWGSKCKCCGLPAGEHRGSKLYCPTQKKERNGDMEKGTRVEVTGDFGALGNLMGKTGTVIVTKNKTVGVEFDEPLAEGGHDCGGAGKAGHCRLGDLAHLTVIGKPTRKKKGEQEKQEPKKIEETDTWKLLYALRDAPEIHRQLYVGPPGTGKTSAACKVQNGGKVYSITLHQDSVVESLIGHYVPKGDAFEYHYGPAPLAMKEGATLVCNEIDLASGPVHTIMHSIMDDLEIACLALPNGEEVRPAKGFRVICTMNGDPMDLPEPLRDRFEVILNVDHLCKDALLRLPENLRDLAVAAYSNKTKIPYTYRQIHAFSKLQTVLGEDKAGGLIFGGQWQDIKNTIKIGRR